MRAQLAAAVARLRRPNAWALVAFVALTAALCLPPMLPDVLFWGLAAVAALSVVAWALSLDEVDA